jgi:hypothetical protein
MNRERARAHLHTQPGRSCAIYLVLEEDTYETRFGDGYYPHFLGAYWSKDSARASIEDLGCTVIECRYHPEGGPCFQKEMGPNVVPPAYHLISAILSLRDGEPYAGWKDYFEHTADIQQRILESLPEGVP